MSTKNRSFANNKHVGNRNREATQVAKYNYRSTDWEEFRKSLEDKLAVIQIVENIPMEEVFHEQIERLDTTIKAAIKEQVPVSKPSPYTKRWWTKNLSKMKKCKEWLARKLSEDVIELLIYHQPSVKPSLTLRPFGVLGYVAGHSLTEVIQEKS